MAQLTPEEIRRNFEDLDYTQGIRKEIVEKIKSKALEGDIDYIDATEKLLSGLDKVSINRLKINEKSKENETKADEAAALAQYLISLNERRSEGQPRQNVAPQNRQLPASLKPVISEEVLDRSPSPENSSEFRQRMEDKKLMRRD